MDGFVLGNGVSRLAVSVDDLLRRGPVYGCNALYRQHRVTALVATDRPIARAIEESGYALENRFYTRRPLAGSGSQPVPKIYQGFSSGPIAAAIAAGDGCQNIFLIGFDLGGLPDNRFNNVYAGTEFYKVAGQPATFSGNWQRQLIRIMQDHPDRRFFRVCGETTAGIPEFQSVINLTHIGINEFLQQINISKEH